MIKTIDKGKQFENKIANLLTKTTGLKWYRTPQSGAFATRTDHPGVEGDVYCTDHPVVIECKAVKQLTINELFSQKSKFFKYIQQTRRESKGADWVLFIKPNNVGIYAITTHKSILTELKLKTMSVFSATEFILTKIVI